MKTRNLILILFGIPLLIMVIINEITRLRFPNDTMNLASQDKENCSWTCHHNTAFCKKNHVKLLNNHFQYTDKFYFGIIKTLQSLGNYSLANIILFVLFIPGLTYFFIIKSVQIQNKINYNKR